MSQTSDSQKYQQLLIGGGVLIAAIVVLVLAKYIPIVLASLVPSFVLAMALDRGTAKERGVRYLAVLGVTAYILFLLVGVPWTKSFGVLDTAFVRSLAEQILTAWDEWFSSVVGGFKGAAREKVLTQGVTALAIQSYVLMVLPTSVVLSGIIVAIRALKKSAPLSRPMNTSAAGDGAVRFWRWMFFWQVLWPAAKAQERPVFSFFMGFVGLIALGVVTQDYKALWPVLNFHFALPALTLFFAAAFLFVGNWLANFKPTAPLLGVVGELTSGVAALSRKVMRGDLKRIENAIAVGEVASQVGLFEDRRFLLSETNLNYHVEIIGGSGAGKTNLLQLLIGDRIERGHGLIFVDLKADFETVDWMTGAALTAGRESQLRVFSLMDREISVGYNPVASGTVNEIHSRIMQSLAWSEEYYRKAAASALSDVLLGLCEIREKTNEQFTLKTIHELLSSPEVLDAFLLRPELTQETREVLKARNTRLRTKDGSQEIMGLITDLQNLIRSSAGRLLTDDALGAGAIDLMRSIQSQEIVYCLMNSMQDKESSVAIGKLFLQDLISTVGRIYREVPEAERRPVTLIVDEFASFATDNFIDLINRARGAKMGIIVAHQSRGDLRAVSDTFCDQLERNANTKVIFGTDNTEDAQYYASMVGTQKNWKETVQVKEGLLWNDMATGVKSLREVEEFLVHPNVIKRLEQGQAFIVKRQRDVGFGIVNFYLAQAYRYDGGSMISSGAVLADIRKESLKQKSKMLTLPRPVQVPETKVSLHKSVLGIEPALCVVMSDEEFT